MIIGFGGRLRSGKTDLSRICEKYGFQRIYFALPLKQLIADLIDKTIDDVNELKNVENEYILNYDKIKFLSEETNIPIEIVEPLLAKKIFRNTREMLQYIGTDIIRKYNKDWHVDKIRNMIDITKNYVIDDVRFPNEKEMIQTNNGILFFVVRPILNNISNHESEISLKWQDFDNIIINDGGLEELRFKWDSFMKNGFVKSLLQRVQLINKLHIDYNFRTEWLTSNNRMDMCSMLFITKYEFNYVDKFLHKNDSIINIEAFNNSLFRVYYKNGDTEVVTNPLMIEDLKFYYGQKRCD